MTDRKLIEFAPGLWYAEAEVRFLGVLLSTRMTVVALPDGGLALISPLVMADDIIRQLAPLGPVRHAMSPNKIHNLGLESVAHQWPQVQVWASPGLPERRPGITYAGVLDDTPHPDWAGVLDQLTTQGNTFFSEVVFFHLPSKTLIVADLIENFTDRTKVRPVARAAAKAMHIYGRALPSPEFRAFTEDAAAAGARLDQIGAWPFEHILLAHGEMIHGFEQSHEVLREVRDFLVAEVEARPAYRRKLYHFIGAIE